MSGPTTAALLLAGGASRRMGSAKAMLDFAGRPLWKVQLEKLQALAPAELFISAPRDLAFPDGDWKILHDEKPALGPLAGICSAHRAMSSDWLVVLAIDLPAMTPTYLQRLHGDALARKIGQVPQLDGYYLGLAAIYPRAFLEYGDRHLESEDRSLQRFVRRGIEAGFLAAHPVPEAERGFYFNMNDRFEYAETGKPRRESNPLPLDLA